MKTLILISVLALSGCAFLGEQFDYQKACAADPVCLESAKKDAELVKSVVAVGYPAAAGIAGSLIFSLSLWLRGRKKETK